MPLLVARISLQALKYTCQKVVLRDSPSELGLRKEVYPFLGRKQMSTNHWSIPKQGRWTTICVENKHKFWKISMVEHRRKEKNMGEED
jgi:hypothetical protein